MEEMEAQLMEAQQVTVAMLGMAEMVDMEVEV
jgi:hypothetical protein